MMQQMIDSVAHDVVVVDDDRMLVIPSGKWRSSAVADWTMMTQKRLLLP